MRFSTLRRLVSLLIACLTLCGYSRAEAQENTVENKGAFLEFNGGATNGRSVTVVPVGAFRVEVESRVVGPFAGVVGAAVEAAVTSDSRKIDEELVAAHLQKAESDPRITLAARLAEYLSKCFATAKAATTVFSPTMKSEDWLSDEKVLPQGRYQEPFTTDYLIEAYINRYTLASVVMGKMVEMEIDIAVYRTKDNARLKTFPSIPSGRVDDYDPTDGLAELDSATDQTLRRSAKKLGENVCKRI